MSWLKNNILLSICTILGGIAAIGYFSEKIVTYFPSSPIKKGFTGLDWWDVIIGIAIIIIPYISLLLFLSSSRKNLMNNAREKAGLEKPAEYYETGVEQWRIGLGGFYLRIRGQILVIIMALLLISYTKWIWPKMPNFIVTYMLQLSSLDILFYTIPTLASLYLIISNLARFVKIK